MKRTEFNDGRAATVNYVSPEATVIQVAAEHGLAISGDAPDYNEGGGLDLI